MHLPTRKISRFTWIGIILVTILALCVATPRQVASSLFSENKYLPVIFHDWPSPTPTPGPGRVFITEILYDPNEAEPDAEWFEIFNAGGSPLELSGYKIGDEENPGEAEGMFQFPPGATLQPGEVIVIANRAITFKAIFGFDANYELRESDPYVPNLLEYTNWASGVINLSNTGDEVILLDEFDQRVEAVSWGNSPLGFDPPVSSVSAGHSLERKPAYQDTDCAEDWIDQKKPNPGIVDTRQPTATPTQTPTGATTPTLPSPLRLYLSEVLYDPFEAGDPAGEWIELYNASGLPLPLSGFKIGDEETPGGGEGMMQFPEGSVLLPGQTLVIANQASIFRALYSIAPDYEIIDSDNAVPDLQKYPDWASGTVNLSNSGDELILLDPQDRWADALAWGSSSSVFDPAIPLVVEGHSLERYPPGEDSDSALDWREQAHPAPGDVDLTPPTATPSPTFTPTPTKLPTASPIPTLVINEIHADPDIALGDANGDELVDATDDEFIEIVNITGLAVDLSGWRISDPYGVRHILPEGSLIPDACALLIFGGGTPSGGFGGSLVQSASGGTLSLNNNGDTLALFDVSNQPVISYTYGTEGGDNQSLTRDPDISGPMPLVKHSTANDSGGAIFSPGVRVDGTPFWGCAVGLDHSDR